MFSFNYDKFELTRDLDDQETEPNRIWGEMIKNLLKKLTSNQDTSPRISGVHFYMDFDD
jgi:hypothetical protein